ncbi:MAG: hypothetical protein RLZZ196_198 [Bacteroidota bacterium]|jgi:hypothetical protein
MDQEEILQYASKIISTVGNKGEDLFALGSAYERISIFSDLRKLIAEKDSFGDSLALDVLCWAYDRLANEE